MDELDGRAAGGRDARRRGGDALGHRGAVDRREDGRRRGAGGGDGGRRVVGHHHPAPGHEHHDRAHHRDGTDEERRARRDALGEAAGEVGRHGAAGEAHERVGGRGDRALDVGHLHHRLGEGRVDDAEQPAGEDDRDDEHDLVIDAQPGREQVGGEEHEDAEERGHVAEAPLEDGREEHRRDRQAQAPAEEDEPEGMGAEVEREGRRRSAGCRTPKL